MDLAGWSLVSAPGSPSFAEAFTRALQHSGMTLDGLQRALADTGVSVSAATLSYWSTGRSRPTRASSAKVVGAVEVLLEQVPGSLTSLLGRGPVAPAQRARPNRDSARRLVAEFGSKRHTMQTISRLGRLVLGPEGEDVAHVNEDVGMCVEDGLRSKLAVHWAESDGPVRGELTDVWGVEPGRVIADPGRSLLVAELRYARPLLRGERSSSGYTVRWHGVTGRSTQWQRGCQAWLRQIVLEVAFHPAAVPLRVRAVHQPSMDPDASETDGEPSIVVIDDDVPITDGTAQFISIAPQPGMLSLQWDWDEGPAVPSVN